MKKYKIGLYEKAIRNSLSWKEKLEVTKECGYDYLEISIDASEEKINRLYAGIDEWKKIALATLETGVPIQSMSVSALTKYALGDLKPVVQRKAISIAEKAIEMAAFLGIRTVMLPGYDIYYGESTVETKKKFLENIKHIVEIAEREGVFLGFETMENDFMNSTAKAAQWIRMVDSAYLKIYPDSGNITNAAVKDKYDVCDDLMIGKGMLISLHLKETKPGIFREVPFFTGYVEFERIIETAWKLGVRRFVTELWDVGEDNWKENICFANRSMRAILDQMV